LKVSSSRARIEYQCDGKRRTAADRGLRSNCSLRRPPPAGIHVLKHSFFLFLHVQVNQTLYHLLNAKPSPCPGRAITGGHHVRKDPSGTEPERLPGTLALESSHGA